MGKNKQIRKPGPPVQDNLNSRISRFWEWFQTAIASGEKAEDLQFLKQIDDQVRNLNPSLSWEVGPGFSEPWRFVISPNLDRELRDTARAVIAHAPVLAGWEFYSSRQPKEWDFTVHLLRENGSSIQLDASNWTFVLLRYPDAVHELLLRGTDLSTLNQDERWQAAAITVESILGEDLMMERIDDFELVEDLEPEFAKKERPIRELKDAIRGPF